MWVLGRREKGGNGRIGFSVRCLLLFVVRRSMGFLEFVSVGGSDIHVFHGLHPYTKYPVVQGHGVSGVIAEVGR